jgi:hypothetical protein
MKVVKSAFLSVKRPKRTGLIAQGSFTCAGSASGTRPETMIEAGREKGKRFIGGVIRVTYESALFGKYYGTVRSFRKVMTGYYL